MVKDNIYIDEIEIEGIAPAPKGVPQIEVTFDIDAMFRLVVIIEDKANAATKTSKVIKSRNRPNSQIPNDKIATIRQYFKQ
jgi:molecular chaperone DnaK (HSP70)